MPKFVTIGYQDRKPAVDVLVDPVPYSSPAYLWWLGGGAFRSCRGNRQGVSGAKTMTRALWVLGSVAALLLACLGFWWMIQGAWLASFPERHGEMNPAMWVRSLVFVGGLAGSIYCGVRATGRSD